jgi:minor fimbrial subunit
MKKIITLLLTLLLAGWSLNAWSFACKTAAGDNPHRRRIGERLREPAPAVSVGQNLVVDLSTQIFCHNDFPDHDRLRNAAARLGLRRGAVELFRHRQV